MHQWLSEPINDIDRLGRRKRRRGCRRRTEIAKAIWERTEEDELHCHPQVLFSFSCVGRGGSYLWSRRTRFPPSEMPHGSVAEDTLTLSRADYLPRGSVHAVVVVGGEGVIGEDVAHLTTLPFMHIISLSWVWAALGTQQHSSSHHWFGIVMRSHGWKVSMHTHLHLFSQEGDQCVCVCV